jgi:hypothetical protein
MYGMTTVWRFRARAGRISRAWTLRYHSAMRLVLRHVMVVSLVLLASVAHGADSEDASPTSPDVVEDAGAAARQAVDMTGGRVLDVQKRFFGERAMYVVKVLLHDGRVKVVEVEANPTSGPDFMER